MRNKIGGISMYVGLDECDYGKFCEVVGVGKPFDNCEYVLCVFRDYVTADDESGNVYLVSPGDTINIKDCSLIPISDPDQADEIKRETIEGDRNYKHVPGPHKEVI